MPSDKIRIYIIITPASEVKAREFETLDIRV